MNVIFTQADGFTDYEVPEALELGDGTYDEEMERVGFKWLWNQSGHDHRENLRATDFPDQFVTPGSSVCYEYTGEDLTVPKYLVVVEYGGDQMHTWVHVRTQGDLFSLRIQLAQLMSVSTIGTLDDIRVILSRMFRVLHKHHHRYDDCCAECDPEEAAYRKRLKMEAEKKAEARKKVETSTTESTVPHVKLY